LLLGEGAGIREVDDAMRDAGFPVGPFKLLDEVGLDVAGSVTRVLAPLFAERGLELVQAGDALRAAGLTGRKGGRGFYRYEGGKSGAPNPDAYRALGAAARREVPSEEIRERLLLIMMNEAVHCLEEGIISGPTDGDVGAVF